MQERTGFDIGSAPVGKIAMQNFYKQQLDQAMEDKNRQKAHDRQEKERNKHEENQRIQKLNEMEHLKELSYKNYYQMLMNNQERNNQQFVESSRLRDDMKYGLISKSTIDFDHNRNIDQEMRLRELQMKEEYKQHLDQQIDDRSKTRSLQKLLSQNMDRDRETVQTRRISEWERKKKNLDQFYYKEELDKATEEKERSKSKRKLGVMNDFNRVNMVDHNPLNNPVPFNIQNPYILRQLGGRGNNYSSFSQITNDRAQLRK